MDDSNKENELEKEKLWKKLKDPRPTSEKIGGDEKKYFFLRMH